MSDTSLGSTAPAEGAPPPEPIPPEPIPLEPVQFGSVPCEPTLADRLGSIEDALRGFQQRSAHREAVIDRLHEENQVLREGLRRTILQPILTDLLKLYDGLSQQASRVGDDPARTAERGLWAGFADDVAMALERCGADIVTSEPGDAYVRGRHVAAGFVDHPDPPPGDVVAEMLAVGLIDQENGRIRRPVRVRLYRAAAAGETREGSASAQ